MPEITLEEYELMNRILSDTRTGWWKADYRLQTYFFSKQIMELTGLPSDRLSFADFLNRIRTCLLYTSPSPRDAHESRMPSSA